MVYRRHSYRYSNWASIGTTTATSFDVTRRTSGTYLYRIKGIFGDCGGASSDGPYSETQQITVELGPPTLSPTADFTATPSSTEVGETITFDASASHDNDVHGAEPSIGRYFWSFGDGGTLSSTDPVVTHAYAAAGIYRVLLTVIDNEGETAESEAYIVINEPQPGEINASGSGYIIVGQKRANFGFDASTTGAHVSGSLEYHDRANHLKVTAIAVDTVQRFGNRVAFSGTCTLNKHPGLTFTVEVVDQGGAGDTFRLRLSNGYDVSGPVHGGDIRIGP